MSYISFYLIIDEIMTAFWVNVGLFLSLFVQKLIGYCHFFYQINYGFAFYIYFYRRYKAKKTKNWSTFYGNSVPNWLLLNVSIFNKLFFNRNFLLYVKTKVAKTIKIVLFLLHTETLRGVIPKTTVRYKNAVSRYFNVIWTPIFKKSSYISFVTFLKRFSKRK